MRTDPKLTESFVNKLWIRFFLTAVYSTMYVRDHARPEFHKALGVDIEWYDQEVFRKTSAIAKQVFPLELDIDHPRWLPNLRKMEAARQMEAVALMIASNSLTSAHADALYKATQIF
jgi:magnesium-protoporphyrin IX monomethyl ester (oxidative) cyclase